MGLEDLDQVMTVQEVADYLQVHTNTIYLMCKRKEIPHYRLGANIRFIKKDIEALRAF